MHSDIPGLRRVYQLKFIVFIQASIQMRVVQDQKKNRRIVRLATKVNQNQVVKITRMLRKIKLSLQILIKK